MRMPWHAPQSEFRRSWEIEMDAPNLSRIRRRPRPSIRPEEGEESIARGEEISGWWNGKSCKGILRSEWITCVPEGTCSFDVCDTQH